MRQCKCNFLLLVTAVSITFICVFATICCRGNIQTIALHENYKNISDITAEYAFRKNQMNVSTINWKELRINPYRYEWTILEKDLCTKRYPNVKRLIIVHSAPNHFEHRNDYRVMYGDKFYKEFGIVTIFALGRASNATVQKGIVEEAIRHRDIIQQNFWDTYETLTFKAVMWLRFVSEYCNFVEHIFKIDDDIVINIYRIVELLEKQNHSSKAESVGKRTLNCMVLKNTGPIRNRQSKWYISYDEYPYNVYDDYCSGYFLTISGPLALKFHNASNGAIFLRFDDAFLTGRLARKVGNVIFNDIGGMCLCQISISSQDSFLKETVIYGVVADRALKVILWKELNRLKYNRTL